VQGVGDDQPIMQWTPLIQRLQDQGVPVIVDLSKHELDDFMAAMRPESLFLWIATDNTDEELAIIEKLLTWR
jgi:fructose-1-phosphate kinase PfkB-like protein